MKPGRSLPGIVFARFLYINRPRKWEPGNGASTTLEIVGSLSKPVDEIIKVATSRSGHIARKIVMFEPCYKARPANNIEVLNEPNDTPSLLVPIALIAGPALAGIVALDPFR
jgi:hypothetical protein